VEYLARALNCSKRTVFRDIKLLNDNNIRVWFDERLGGYTAEHQLWALAASMDEEEFVNLLAAALLSPMSALTTEQGIVDQAVGKLMQRASRQTRNRVNRLVRAIVPPLDTVKLAKSHQNRFREIVQAIEGRYQIRVRWKEPGNASPLSTKLCPYRLIFDVPPPAERGGRLNNQGQPSSSPAKSRALESQWLVGGRSSLHRKVVHLRLKRITRIESTTESFEVPLEYLQGGYTGTAMVRAQNSTVGTVPQPPRAVPPSALPRVGKQRPPRRPTAVEPPWSL
jgi:hypothetical protein